MEITWLNFETDNKELRDYLRVYLHELSLDYELSDCYTGWRFEVYCNTQERIMIDEYLDEYYETEVA